MTTCDHFYINTRQGDNNNILYIASFINYKMARNLRCEAWGEAWSESEDSRGETQSEDVGARGSAAVLCQECRSISTEISSSSRGSSSGRSSSGSSAATHSCSSSSSCYCDEDGVFNNDCDAEAPNIPEDFVCCKRGCLNDQFINREELHRTIGK